MRPPTFPCTIGRPPGNYTAVAKIDHAERLRKPQYIPSDHPDFTLIDAIRRIYAPVLHPIDAPSFTDWNGTVYNLSGEPRFTEPLGKKVLILDVDTRPLDKHGQLMADEELQWNSIGPLTAGVLHHYLYGTNPTLPRHSICRYAFNLLVPLSNIIQR